MPYLIERTRALRTEDIVAAVQMSQRRIRSRVILRDNSLYHTLTRTKTLARAANRPAWGDQGVQGWKQP